MCGIAGIVSRNPSLVQQQKLQAMANAINHRGPDGEGFWINENNTVGFAHRRLAIIDLSHEAAQPMHFMERYTIVFNGEIYNYIELRNELKQQGYEFRTQSDTEVLLAAYDHWNDECVEHLDGMFTLAIWDNEYEELFAARDRFGEKPFYYYIDDEQFVFGSEMKALWAMGIAKQPNNSMLLSYLTIGYTGNAQKPEETFYSNIRKLPAASRLVYSVGDSTGLLIDNYWDIDKEATCSLSIDEATQKLQDLLLDSVSKRLRSDVPVGTSLSGGLDSSSIVAIINQLQTPNSKPSSFSAIFPGFEKDESKSIAAIANHFSIISHTIEPTATGFVDDFEKMMYHQEEPVQSASIYAQYKVYELAKQHGVTVLLDGQGADETLAGYTKYYHWFWQELVSKGKFALVKQERNTTTSKEVWCIKNYLAAVFPSVAAKQLENNLYKKVKAQKDINPDFFMQHFDKDALHKPVISKLNDVLYHNTMQNGLEELLRYADRNSMAHSREVRLPFLQHELVQFIFSLPSSFKIKDGFTKWILRDAMTGMLPNDILWNKNKIGFEPPQHVWMQQQPMVDLIHEAKKKLVHEKILQQPVLNKPIAATTAHGADGYDWRYLCTAMLWR